MVSRIYFLGVLIFLSFGLVLSETEPLLAHAEAVNAAQTCACPSHQELEPAFDAAAIVFVGRVEEKHINPLKKGAVEVRFQVTRRLKGFEEVKTDRVLVYTPAKSDTPKADECPFEFVTNGEYLVYALGTPAYFRTTACTRTSLLEKAAMDVQRIIRLYASE